MAVVEAQRMAGLVLDEGRVGTVFYEVADIAVAQAVHRQLGRQAGAPAPLGEALVYAPGRYTRPPFGEPQRRSPGRLAVQWAHLFYVLGQRFHGPGHDRGDCPAPGRAAPHRLAETHVADAVTSQLGCGRVRAEVGHVEHGRLPAAQAPAVGHLYKRGIPERRQPAFARRAGRLVHGGVGGVEQRLQLGAGERPAPGAALVVGDMGGAVPARPGSPGRCDAHPLQAGLGPAVAGVADISKEQRQRALVVAHR